VAGFFRRRKSLAVPKLEPRLIALTALMLAALAVLTVRLYYLQVIESQEMTELADRNRIRTLRMPAPRGIVFDRRHRPLVDTRPTFDAVVVPEDTKDLSATIARLETLLGGDHVAGTISQAQDEGRPAYDPITVDERLTWPQVVALETHQLELPGVSLQVTPRRHYLYGDLAAHLLGYVGETTQADLVKLAGYHMGDEIGKFGLERGWEPFLRGVSGGQEIEVDAVGRRLRLLREVPDRPGQSVVLTIDLDLQQAAEKALGDRAGALVALDPNSGEILAMASHPGFDPNLFGAGGISGGGWRKLMTDPNHPLQNRAIQGTYPPGSVFKIIDTIAGLEEGTLKESTGYACAGGIWYGHREYRCWRKQGHGGLTLHRAIVESCDVYFYNVGIHLGIDRLAKWAHLLGFGVPTGIELDNEKGGVVPSSVWKQKRFHERWYPAETLSVAIGQGYVNATPLELAQLAEQVANGGIRYKPHFVKLVEALDGGIRQAYEPEIEGRVDIDPHVLQVVRDGMEGVVNGPGGTAHKAQLPGIIVCGKTGTAQVVKEGEGSRLPEEKQPERFRDHAWFIAFAPKDHPRIAVACLVEHGGHGGSAAAPPVHDVLAKFFELYPSSEDSRPVITKTSGARLVDAREEAAR
jgi:penicillin-binding protein 2